jgi:hypothetical protein
MEFFCYHRDRPGSTALRSQMVEQHWSYMDQFATTMIARGPTFTSDGTLTGSVHILDLPDPAAARTFAFEEPGYQAGAYRDVLRRWHNSLGRTMWDFSGGQPDNNRYLVLGFTSEPAADATELPRSDELIACGPLCRTTDPKCWGRQFCWRRRTQTERGKSSPLTIMSGSRCISGSSVGVRSRTRARSCRDPSGHAEMLMLPVATAPADRRHERGTEAALPVRLDRRKDLNSWR